MTLCSQTPVDNSSLVCAQSMGNRPSCEGAHYNAPCSTISPQLHSALAASFSLLLTHLCRLLTSFTAATPAAIFLSKD